MWRLKIEQYFQVQDYALWDVIENGKKTHKTSSSTTTNAPWTSTSLLPVKDVKTLFTAIQTRFGGNDATKKTQKTLLKQMNKPDLYTISFDDLYNNFKIVKQEVKGTASSSSHNLACVSSTSSTNEVNTAYGVSTANTQVSTANLSDDTVYAFLSSQPNGS
ncbi:hypothetical protein Tco_0037260 [Tanacetum coccineum]